MAFTQTQLDAIDAAIASGELTVSFNGRTVTYRSLNDLMRARKFVASQLCQQAGACKTAGGLGYSVMTYGNNS